MFAGECALVQMIDYSSHDIALFDQQTGKCNWTGGEYHV